VKPDTRQDYEERILRVLVYLQRHLDRSPSLEDLAAVAHFSPFHFHRIFRGLTGESVQAHQRRLRLERAAGQLRQSADPVIRIAL
jgi:AraC family transcriptional regulator